MNADPTIQRARFQARNFVELLFDELPAEWHRDEFNRLDLALWLAVFADIAKGKKLTGLRLLTAAQQHAETKYQQDFKQSGHTLQHWAFFRFRLELALLRTVGAPDGIIRDCYELNDVTAAIAVLPLN